MENVKIEIETPKELQKKRIVRQTFVREIVEREAEKLAPDGLEVNVLKVTLEGGSWRGDTERGSQAQKGQAPSPAAGPEVGAADLQGLASALVASGSQSGGERGTPVLPSSCDTHPLGNCLDLTHIVVTFCLGHLNYKMPPAEKASRVRAAFSTSPHSTSHICIPSTALPMLSSIVTLLSWLLSLYLGTCCFPCLFPKFCLPLPGSERKSLSLCSFHLFPTVRHPYSKNTIVVVWGEVCGQEDDFLPWQLPV